MLSKSALTIVFFNWEESKLSFYVIYYFTYEFERKSYVCFCFLLLLLVRMSIFLYLVMLQLWNQQGLIVHVEGTLVQ